MNTPLPPLSRSPSPVGEAWGHAQRRKRSRFFPRKPGDVTEAAVPSDGNGDRVAGGGGVERLLHHAKDAARLGEGDDRLGFAVDRKDEVTVEIVDVGRGAGPIVLVEGDLVAGRHGFGDAGGGLHGKDVGFVPRLTVSDAGILPPVGDEGASLLRLQIEAREGEEIRRRPRRS